MHHPDRHALASRFPPITLGVSDHRRLQLIAIRALLNDPRNAGALLDEIDRADVIDDALVDESVVRLGDLVTYREHASGEERVVQLLAQPDEDPGGDMLSVLSSCGAALVGLRVGQSILWCDRRGSEQIYTVLGVRRRRGEEPL
jgi:regulator of nucleoside diphosphate kinase